MSKTDRPRFHFQIVDYRERDGGQRGQLINRGYFLHNTPRLIPICRLLGHKPVVDGVDFRPIHVAGGIKPSQRSRWACCDRCGVRLQQPVDCDLETGQPYTDPLPTPVSPRGTVGAQLIIGASHGGAGVGFKIGNAGSEQTLAAHVQIHPLGALYLHTEDHGTWLQRRLNSVGYHSRIVEVAVHNGHLHWELWAKRDEHKRSDPWWMHGSVEIDPRTILCGPRRYTYTDTGALVEATVRMPHGDDHPVRLQLQRQTLGRARGRRPKLSWSVDWSAPSGIPTRNTDRGRIYGSGVHVSDRSATDGGWVEEACAAIATQMTGDRVRYSYARSVSA